jgi:hypothetical protein
VALGWDWSVIMRWTTVEELSFRFESTLLRVT